MLILGMPCSIQFPRLRFFRIFFVWLTLGRDTSCLNKQKNNKNYFILLKLFKTCTIRKTARNKKQDMKQRTMRLWRALMSIVIVLLRSYNILAIFFFQNILQYYNILQKHREIYKRVNQYKAQQMYWNLFNKIMYDSPYEPDRPCPCRSLRNGGPTITLNFNKYLRSWHFSENQICVFFRFCRWKTLKC